MKTTLITYVRESLEDIFLCKVSSSQILKVSSSQFYNEKNQEVSKNDHLNFESTEVFENATEINL